MGTKVLSFWKPKDPIEKFAKTVMEEFLRSYGFNQKRGFLSELSQLALEGILLTLNEFLKEVSPAVVEFVKAGLKSEIRNLT